MLTTSYRSYSGHQIAVSMRYSEVKALFRAIRSPLFIHARTRNFCMHDVCSIYHRSSESPSGKIQVAAGADVIVSAILGRCKRTSPLSPTEGLSIC